MIAINYYEFWDKEDFIFPKISKNIYEYFTVEELKSLTEIGLPEWVAPHILFYEVFEDFGCYISIGEDSQDRVITVCKTSKTINVLSDDKTFCNSSFRQFIETLYIYASIIDEAIKINESFSSENGVDKGLMECFKNRLKKNRFKSFDR